MKKFALLTVTLMTLSHFTLLAQNRVIKSVRYARTEIQVPSGYTAKDQYSLKSDFFSTQWLYLTKEMVKQDVQDQIMKQFEARVSYDTSEPVTFVSNGASFSGKKYHLKGNDKMKFRILAFGSPAAAGWLFAGI